MSPTKPLFEIGEMAWLVAPGFGINGLPVRILHRELALLISTGDKSLTWEWVYEVSPNPLPGGIAWSESTLRKQPPDSFDEFKRETETEKGENA